MRLLTRVSQIILGDLKFMIRIVNHLGDLHEVLTRTRTSYKPEMRPQNKKGYLMKLLLFI